MSVSVQFEGESGAQLPLTMILEHPGVVVSQDVLSNQFSSKFAIVSANHIATHNECMTVNRDTWKENFYDILKGAPNTMGCWSRSDASRQLTL